MFQNKVMFADKLQNPFLKPSPFVASPYLPSYTSSYNAPPLPSTYKYNSYKTYEQPPALNYKNKSYETPLSYNVRESEAKDIDTMLINNPFNRKSSNFGGSSTSDLSPSKYSNQATSYNKPKINNNYQNYQYVPPSYENILAQPKSYRDSQRLTPTKKYDNYLSTSSADSAATYINRITDFEEDKASVYEAKTLPENPFYRKNLLQRTTQVQKIPTKDYEASAGLKYMSYKIEGSREVPPVKIDQNSYPTYVEDDYQSKDISYKYNYQNTFSKDKNQTYEEQKSAKFGSKQEIYGEYKYSFQKGDIPVYDYQTYESKQTNSKYNKYEYKGQNYDTYKQPPNYQPIDKIQNYAYDSNKFNQKNSVNAQYEKVNYNSYKEEPRFGSIKDSYKPEKTYQEPRVRFDEDQEAQSSKFKSYKGIDINLDNLGANPYLAYTAQSKTKIQQPPTYSHEKNYAQPYKLTSSQVDEYTGPQQMQKKIKQNKYQKLGLQKQMQNYTKKVSGPPARVEVEDSNNAKPIKSGAPMRDSHQYPIVLEYKGVLFHKIEVV